ncbi:hypothetical protein PM082_001684 [Marasmius tenuissimus]|nr:hypothetical protein PM082_001684 [Marasmius tenuissimus]
MYVPLLARFEEVQGANTTPSVIPDTSGQTPFSVCMVLGAWVQCTVQGVFVSLYLATIWLIRERSFITTRTERSSSDNVFKIMFILSSLMFFVATFHFAISAYRLVHVWIVGHNLAPPITSLAVLNSWHNVLWVGLYVTQELLGTGAAIYRCWLLWSKDWRVILLPAVVLLVEIGTGYACCALFAQSDPLNGKLSAPVRDMMQIFYAAAVLGNLLPTGLMVYRLWKSHHKSTQSGIKTPSILYPILRILVESASLQLIVEAILLCLFDTGRQEQFIILPLIVPVVGITFSLITIRIKLVAARTTSGGRSTYPSDDSNWRQKNTIGSLPSPTSPRIGNPWRDHLIELSSK